MPNRKRCGSRDPLRARHCHLSGRARAGAARRRPHDRRGRARAGGGSHRCREVDVARRDQWTGPALHRWPSRRPRTGRRARDPHASTARARGRRRCRRPGPALGFRHGHGRGRARVRDGAARPPGRRDAQARRGNARPARTGRAARSPAARAVGRSTATRRDRFGADHAPARPRARRTDIGARPHRGRGGARRDHAARARPRNDGRHRGAPARARRAVHRPRRASRRRRSGHRRLARTDVGAAPMSRHPWSSSAASRGGRRCRCRCATRGVWHRRCARGCLPVRRADAVTA